MTITQKLIEGLTLTIVGMGTVMVSLWLIGEIFNFLRRFFITDEGRAEAPPAPKTSPSKLGAEDAHLIPLLVAAATAAVGRPVVLRRVTFINRDTVSGWAEAGRMSIHSSHNVRRSS